MGLEEDLLLLLFVAVWTNVSCLPPADPARWSVDDVRAWLDQQAAHLQLPPLMLNLCNYGGPELLKLTEAQFRQLAPVGGELLYAQLEIWRGALRATPKLMPQYQHWSAQQVDQSMLLSSFMVPPPQQQQQQQQVPQVESSSQAGSPPHMGSPNHLGSPSSPSMSLPTSLGQVPTPVVQVTQQQQQHQQAVGGGSCPPPAAQRQQAGSGVFLEEQRLDVTALLQQQSSPKAPHTTRLPAHSPQEDGFDSEGEYRRLVVRAREGKEEGGQTLVS